MIIFFEFSLVYQLKEATYSTLTLIKTKLSIIKGNKK